MRIASYILIAVGILLLASAGYDELRGSTRSPSGSRYAINYPHYTITKESQPEQFHNAMAYHWFYAMMLLIAGIVVNLIDRGMEKADPLSPEFAGNKDLDEWGEEMKKEEERRKGPPSP